MKIIETERLSLRPVALSDAAHVREVMTTPKFVKYVGRREVSDTDAARRYIRERMLPQYEIHGYGNHVIERKSDGRAVGTVGIFHRPYSEHPDLGYALIEGYEGYGYASEAARAQLKEGFECYGLSWIYAFALPYHLASIRVLDRLGMDEVGGVRWGDDPGEWLSWYGVSKEAYCSCADHSSNVNKS